MVDKQSLNEESSAVRTHLEIMQGVIQRMAENSRSCKVWCVTLVVASLVLVARTGDAKHALIALAPTALFFVLDACYLALERGFCKSYDAFVGKVHRGQVSTSDLYIVATTGSRVKRLLWAMFWSFSTLPFYAAITVTVLLAWCLVL